MRFRPCIDIHNGKVKQIVGGSLKDHGDKAVENFVSGYDAAFYAELYKKDNLKGGHVILLNPVSSEYYEKNRQQALAALKVFPGGLQVGGGVTAENAAEFIEAGASHVIVTSYVFREGQIQWDNLERLVHAVGKEHIVLDLSCRKKDASYYIVTDRWQTFTKIQVNEEILYWLKESCSEFLVHGVDSEGKAAGVPEDLVALLSKSGESPLHMQEGSEVLRIWNSFGRSAEGTWILPLEAPWICLEERFPMMR